MKRLLFLLAVALLAACGGSDPAPAPLGMLSTPAINDGAAFDVPAGITLPHRLQRLDYVNTSPTPVDLVLTLHAAERLDSTDGARAALMLSADGETARGITHAPLDGSGTTWIECLSLLATAGPNQALTAIAAADLVGAGTLDSRNVVIQALIYEHGRAPSERTCR